MSVVLLAGCTTVGPDYAGPPAQPAREHFVRAEAGSVAVDAPQADWWRAFGDTQLDGLIEAAIAANGDIRVAGARLAEERALLRERGADRGPNGGAAAGYARTKPYIAQFGIDPASNSDFDLYRATIDASWELDLFGARRRGVEAARADVVAVAADLDAAHLSVAAEVAQTYLDLRGLRARIARIHAVADLDSRLIALTEQRRAEGTASDLDLGAIRYQRLATLADEPAMRGEIAIHIDRLAVLTGRDPGALDAELSAPRPVPAPPATVTIGDPATLIRHRPDVRAAERRLAASTARIGVATADLFPRVSLLGSIGRASQQPGDLLDGDATIFSVGPSISWAFLDLQRVRARIAQAGARRDESLALYETAVRAALEDAEAGLTRYLRARETVAVRLQALSSVSGAAVLIEQRQREGTASLYDVMSAQRVVLIQDERVRIAETDLAKAYVALNKSLGLAWGPDASAQPASPR